jgi:rRNA maturation endonuclease Nob1
MTTPGPDEGGDAACWLSRVCPSCGRLADSNPPTECSSCGTEIPNDQVDDRPITS